LTHSGGLGAADVQAIRMRDTSNISDIGSIGMSVPDVAWEMFERQAMP